MQRKYQLSLWKSISHATVTDKNITILGQQPPARSNGDYSSRLCIIHFHFMETRSDDSASGSRRTPFGTSESESFSNRALSLSLSLSLSLNSSRTRVRTNARGKETGKQTGDKRGRKPLLCCRSRCNDELCNLRRVSEATQFTKFLPTRRIAVILSLFLCNVS